MRLFLLPLSTRRSFIYCDQHFRTSAQKLITAGSTSQTTKPSIDATSAGTEASTTPAQPLAQQYIDKFTTKAATTWADWERAEGGWKKQLTVYGNAALRRIPYEEWGLKSFPSLTKSRQEVAFAQHENKPVNVLFPSAFLKKSDVDKTLLTLAQERQAMHSKRMWYCLVGAPLTLPFALIPILPNIPGIYLMFRAWSHFRALYGARYLEFLVSNQMYRPVPSQRLDEIYSKIKPVTFKDANGSKDIALSGDDKEAILLTKDGGQDIAKAFEVNELGVELERAVEQVERAVLKQDQTVKQKAEEAASDIQETKQEADTHSKR